jgi:hypothetical protein
VEYPPLVEAPQPVIDRKSKPPFGGSFSAGNMSSIQVATQDSVSEGCPTVIATFSDKTNSILRPGVDRGSKAAALQTYEERSRAVTELLHAKDKLANKSKELEESRLKAQQEWEILRISKEKEAEEERTKLLQNREEELLLNIRKLELEQQCKVIKLNVLHTMFWL